MSDVDEIIRDQLRQVSDRAPVPPSADSIIERHSHPTVPMLARNRRSWRTRRATLVASVALGAVLLVAVPWMLIQGIPLVSIQSESSPGSPSDDGYVIHPAVLDPAAANPMPRLTLPGWTTTWYAERATTRSGAGPNGYLAILDDPDTGRTVKVGVATHPVSYSGGSDPQPVEVNGDAALLSELPSSVLVVWHPSSTTTISVTATHLTTSEVLDVARGLRLAADFRSVDLTVVPSGLEPRPLNPLDDGQGVIATYQFERGDQRLQLNLYDNGPQGYEQRVSDHETPRAVTAQGVDAVIQDQGGNRYRIDLLDGWWTWEADGQPFTSADDFVHTVDTLRVVGRDEWIATLPRDVVTSGAR